MDSERAAIIVTDKLNELDLKWSHDIFECVTDGSSVVRKMGQEMGVIHQLRHCHGIHLAVCDILYKKKSLAIEATKED